MAELKNLIVSGNSRLIGDTNAAKVTATQFVKSGGTSSQFLKADGSVDSNTYATTSQLPTVNNATLTIQKNGTNVATFTSNASSNSTANITIDEDRLKNTTWSALKTLRDNSQLIPGMQYRITDYNTYVSHVNSYAQSANHQFDIIVKADSTNKLNENARAIQHSGDTYFSACTLSAWQIWYCLDNDTNRFYWADTSSGKGVIYRMIDEWNNDCPYDFKNIQFIRYKVTATDKSNLSSLVNTYISVDTSMNYFTVDSSQSVWRYTFDKNLMDSSSSAVDATLLGNVNQIYNNNIQDYRSSNVLVLNNIIFYGDRNFGNVFKVDCSNNTFGYNCRYNTFGYNCRYNTFGNGCIYNTFGNYCSNNTFGNNCTNTFGNYCSYSTFGNNCINTFEDNCVSNTFGNNCSYNTFGYYCSNNTFGGYCSANTFGSRCQYNTFESRCQYNTFGNGCDNLRFQKDYVNYFIVENGNRYIDITSTQTTSSSLPLRNVTIAQGVNNTTTRKTISHNTVNDIFQTIYCNNSSGNTQAVNVADIAGVATLLAQI